jgi:hemerythrin-like domain-containing protein
MKTATENLENDHVNILRLIDVMEQITTHSAPDADHLELVVNLIRNYADGLHHAKEEKLLFPLMAKKGFSTEHGPIAVMLDDHAEGRNYVKGIAEQIPAYRNGNVGVLSTIFSNMLGYIDLLRGHIQKENNILFRMADNAISETEQNWLLEQFANLENGQSGQETIDNFIEQIENLANIYIR